MTVEVSLRSEPRLLKVYFPLSPIDIPFWFLYPSYLPSLSSKLILLTGVSKLLSVCFSLGDCWISMFSLELAFFSSTILEVDYLLICTCVYTFLVTSSILFSYAFIFEGDSVFYLIFEFDGKLLELLKDGFGFFKASCISSLNFMASANTSSNTF